MTEVSPSSAAAPRSGPNVEYRRGTTFPYPSVTLGVFATAQGVRVSATLWPAGEMGRRKPVILADALFQPSEVTELSVVDWGRRALAKWLEDQMLPGMSEL